MKRGYTICHTSDSLGSDISAYSTAALIGKPFFPNEPYRSPEEQKLMLINEMGKNSGELKDLFKKLEGIR